MPLAKYAIITLTSEGTALGKRLKGLLEDADLYLPKRFGCNEKEIISFEYLREVVSMTFQKYKGLIFIMAVGIVVRTIAPFLKGKREDSGIVVLDEKGRYAISLLSGHLGGANDLARRIGKLLEAQPVITTATDVNNLPCIEELANRFNFVIEDIKDIKKVNSAILEGDNITVIDEKIERLDTLKRYCSNIPNFRFLSSPTSIKDAKGNISVFITNRIERFTIYNLPHPHPLPKGGQFTILRPKDIVVGIGCNRDTSIKEFEDVYSSSLKEQGISPLSVRNLATIDLKRDEEGLLRFAEKVGLNIVFYNKEELKRVSFPSKPSKSALKNIGIGGVCEPAALLSAGANSLLMKKIRIGNITICMAEAPFIILPSQPLL